MTRRWFWPSFALPGAAWLVLLFLVPTYAVLAVAFGTVDPIFQNPVPAWNPIHWQFSTMQSVLADLEPGRVFWIVFVRTFAYVAISLAGCLLIGYPVAYYLSRHARRTKGLLLVLLVIPFWVSYLMRMLAWIGLLLPDGLVNKTLLDVGVLSHPYGWLDGQASSVVLALIYGYVPYLILPLYATLDRIDRSVLEAGRDLGASPIRTFLHVTLPLSRHGILAASVLIALPMFGDYYTNDVISGSPRTSMVGNQINLFFQGGPQKTVGASLVIVLSVLLAVLMSYYLWITVRASAETKESLL
jgi:spermidine/putrescine transport system permease protein